MAAGLLGAHVKRSVHACCSVQSNSTMTHLSGLGMAGGIGVPFEGLTSRRSCRSARNLRSKSACASRAAASSARSVSRRHSSPCFSACWFAKCDHLRQRVAALM